MSVNPIRDRFTLERQAEDQAALAGLLARVTCALVGGSLVLAGIVGFFVDSSFDTGPSVGGSSLLGFEVNGWHNLVHLLTGAMLLAAVPIAPLALGALLAFGLSYLAVTVWGFADDDDVAHLISIDGADNVLHLALTLISLGAALGVGALALASQGTRERAAELRRRG
jgi:hypothetical protein